MQEKIVKVQQLLQEQNIDGWLLYDCCRGNPLACEFLEIPQDSLLTRRFFFWIPKSGNAIKIVPCIEKELFLHLPAEEVAFSTWLELKDAISNIVQDKTIAMEYSPMGALPNISKVDAGTIELIRSFNARVVSSADILQQCTSVWSKEQLEMHLTAAEVLDRIVVLTWDYINSKLIEKMKITEWDVKTFISNQIRENGCITSGGPICAINGNSANPHYDPTEKNALEIKPADWILIDLWCKLDLKDAVYADITRVAVAAEMPTKRQQEIFAIVKEARDRATEYVRESLLQDKNICGWEVDKVCRDIIENKGYGKEFIHRTGHNIGINDHGSGANIDNFETHDERNLLRGTCFSIEPGLYFSNEFGVRLEYDVYVELNGHIQVTGGIQEEIKCLSSVGNHGKIS